MGILDTEINYSTILLFGLMTVLTVLVTICSHPILGFSNIMITFVRYFVLLINIIPVNLCTIIDLNEGKFGVRQAGVLLQDQ